MNHRSKILELRAASDRLDESRRLKEAASMSSEVATFQRQADIVTQVSNALTARNNRGYHSSEAQWRTPHSVWRCRQIRSLKVRDLCFLFSNRTALHLLLFLRVRILM